MELDAKAEEILETLWKLIEEDGQESVEFSCFRTEDADVALQTLARDGNIMLENGRARLEPKGRIEAEKTVRRHRLAERLMVDVLDIGGEMGEESACKFEHLLHKGLAEKICTLLGHPKSCPHGRPIPAGQCCLDSRASNVRLVSPLADLSPGQRGKIAYLHFGEPQKMNKIMAMGILPGSEIALIRRNPTHIFQVGYSQFAVDSEMAGGIFVRLVPNPE